MGFPRTDAPWLGLDPETLRFMEAHQARAMIVPGRAWRELGDAVMLFSSNEGEPFFNRLVAVRWPSEPRAFDARLREACEMFEALDRRPHLWVVPGLSEPADLLERLAASGFKDQGGGYDMVLVCEPSPAEDALPEGAVLERWHRSTEDEIPARAEAMASVVSESFDVPEARHGNLVREISLTLGRPDFHAYVVAVDGKTVATGQRYTFDGASYLSSIGTLRSWRGLGLATHITNALAADSLAEGADLVYLGVWAENAPAIRLYRKLGFAVLGGLSADMLK